MPLMKLPLSESDDESVPYLELALLAAPPRLWKMRKLTLDYLNIRFFCVILHCPPLDCPFNR